MANSRDALFVLARLDGALASEVVDIGEGEGPDASLNLVVRFLLVRGHNLWLLMYEIACDATATQRIAYQLVQVNII